MHVLPCAVVVEGEVPENRFQMSKNVFTLKYRALETFFGGLEHYIGAPSPDILHAMEREHSSEERFNSHVSRRTHAGSLRGEPFATRNS